MAERVLSVCWKEHTNELATVYKSLLENNFLVDCTLSAEGQSLKAHKLVLSACSPYFHMLFREKTGKHTFVIILNTTFETLKAVIDFVYQGESQIPEGNLKAFLTVAQSLQIKGLNAITQYYMNKNLPRNAAANAFHDPLEDNQNSCEVVGSSACQKDSPGNSTLQLPHHSNSHSDRVLTNSSVLSEASSISCETVQSSSTPTPPQERQIPVGCDEVSVDTEISVKHEPLFTLCSDTRNKIVDNVERGEPISENFTSEMDGRTTSTIGEQDLNQYSSCIETSRGNLESSGKTPPQQHLTQLSNEMASGRNVAEDHQPLLPVILVPKSEPVDNAEGEEPMDDYDVPGNETNERVEPSGSGEQYFTHCSNFVEQLLPAHSSNKNKVPRRNLVKGSERLSGRHFIERAPPRGDKQRSKKRCVVCHKRGRRRETVYWCRDCKARTASH